MTQKQKLVGIDIAKEKIDAAIRLGTEASFASGPEGRRELLEWLKEHDVSKAVMEASGGYEVFGHSPDQPLTKSARSSTRW